MKYIITILLASLSLVSSASEHTFTISGYLTTDNSSVAPYLGFGNTFSLAINYNTDTAPSHVFGNSQYTYLLDSATLTLGRGTAAKTFFSENPLDKVIISRGFASSPPDGYQFSLYFPDPLSSSQMMLSTNIAGNFGSNYFTSALSLPLDSLESVDYSKSNFLINDWLPSSIVQTFGRVTSESDISTAVAVPESGTSGVICAAVALLACAIRIRRTKR